MLSVFLLALTLAMDAFAAALCCGVQSGGLRLGEGLTIGLWFGGFQMGMTLLGGLFGRQISLLLWQAGCLLAFGLLAFLGGRMVWAAVSPPKEEGAGRYDLSIPSLAALALATSLDALAAGVSLASLETGLLSAAGTIGAVAFSLSALAGLLGRQLGGRWQRWAGLAGGLILIGLGIKILLGQILM